MTINFYKFEGSGNDFIIIDNRKVTKKFSNAQIKKLCDRKFGIGADGLMLFNKIDGFDFGMSYYNADGNEGSMCGNGGRCMIAFSHFIGNKSGKVKFNAIDGEHEGEIVKQIKENNWEIKLKMTDVEIQAQTKGHFELDTGSPHYVEFLDDIEKLDVFTKGREIRCSPAYSEKGINVNFVKEMNGNLFVRTYERGVENETLSCGTGITASALAHALKNKIDRGTIKIQALGGNLSVSYRKENDSFKDVWLTGPVTFVFKGELNIDD